jgi:hypothetical protein
MASGWREPTGMPFCRPVHTGPLAKLESYFFAAALASGLTLASHLTQLLIFTAARNHNPKRH